VAVVVGPAPDAAVFGDDAEEDPELCAQCSGEASDGERWSCGSGESRRDTGGGVCQTGGEDDLHPRLSAEDSAAGERVHAAVNQSVGICIVPPERRGQLRRLM